MSMPVIGISGRAAQTHKPLPIRPGQIPLHRYAGYPDNIQPSHRYSHCRCAQRPLRTGYRSWQSRKSLSRRSSGHLRHQRHRRLAAGHIQWSNRLGIRRIRRHHPGRPTISHYSRGTRPTDSHPGACIPITNRLCRTNRHPYTPPHRYPTTAVLSNPCTTHRNSTAPAPRL